MPQKRSATPRDAATPADPAAALPAKAAPSGHVSTKRRPATAKPSAARKPSTGEVVPALLSKHELRPMINKARKHGSAFQREGQLLAAELHCLQEAEAHLTYGRESFGSWAATEFADLDLTAANANKLSQQGRAILLLQSNGRVDLKDPDTLPGTTGTRALVSVLANHDEQAMLKVFDACPEGHVVATTVSAVADALLPPPPATAPPLTAPDEDEGEEPEEDPPEEIQRLQASIERIRDLLDELYLADDIDPIAVQRAYKHLLEDTQALSSVLDAVAMLPVEDAEP
jgi:hypothetical protein